jgi:hypothetical protein
MRIALFTAAIALALVLGSQFASAEESCAGSGTPMTKQQVQSQLVSQGYTDVREIKSHGGCYEAKGLDKNGQRFELEVNSFTGKISTKESE